METLCPWVADIHREQSWNKVGCSLLSKFDQDINIQHIPHSRICKESGHMLTKSGIDDKVLKIC